MNYNTVYVGMDVHKESFSLCAYTIEAEKASHYQRTEADYKKVLNYLEFLRTIYGDDANFICGYEAGCFGYTLYHQLTANNVKCIILAPTTMLEQRSKKRIKTDRRDAEIIAKCLAQHNYSPVHIPTAKDEETKEFLRMRDDHKLALKKVKQQILAFCLRHNYRYDGKSHWTAAHLKWLKALTPEALYKEILDEYLLTYQTLSDKIERLDKRIEELATQDEYKEAVKTYSAHSVNATLGKMIAEAYGLGNLQKESNPDSALLKRYTRHYVYWDRNKEEKKRREKEREQALGLFGRSRRKRRTKAVKKPRVASAPSLEKNLFDGSGHDPSVS